MLVSKCTARWLSYTYLYILFHKLFHDGLPGYLIQVLCGIVGPVVHPFYIFFAALTHGMLITLSIQLEFICYPVV